MITVKNLTKKYASKKKIVTAVTNLSFEVHAGEIFGLLGENGAGKTTTIKMLSTIITPTSGDAIINGYSVLTQARKVKMSIGVALGDERSFYYRLTGHQNLEFFAMLQNMKRSNVKSVTNNLLEEFGLSGSRDIKFMHYSSGMKRRLSLCRAFLTNPPILILDEPTTGLDPSLAILVRDKFNDCKKIGQTILLSTQNLAEAEKLCDVVGIIKNGELELLSTAVKLKKDFGYSIIKIKLNYIPNREDIYFSSRFLFNKNEKNELIFKIPTDEKTNFLRDLFLKEQRSKYIAESIDIKDPSLEDVFLSIIKK